MFYAILFVVQPTRNQSELKMEIVNRRKIISNIRRYLNEEEKQIDNPTSLSKIENSHIQLKV